MPVIPFAGVAGVFCVRATGGDPDRPVILSDVEHGGDSGFTADPEDWGDIEIIDIPV